MQDKTDLDQLTVAERLDVVRGRLDEAAKAGGRAGADVTLIAVSKTQPADAIAEAIEAGHRDFGENRIQEARDKWPALKERYPDVRLHLIGSIQTNKLRQALGLFDVIHTLDRPKLASALVKERENGIALPPLFVQVNTGEEDQKGGLLPADLQEFLETCSQTHGLTPEGLMCIPPVDEDPALHFSFLAKLAHRHGLEALSMGMSGDYELAAELGSTHVRVGTAIFGPRRT